MPGFIDTENYFIWFVGSPIKGLDFIVDVMGNPKACKADYLRLWETLIAKASGYVIQSFKENLKSSVFIVDQKAANKIGLNLLLLP